MNMVGIVSIVLICLYAGPCLAKLNVVATLPWIGNIASELGKDKIDVTTLARPNQDPTRLKPSRA